MLVKSSKVRIGNNTFLCAEKYVVTADTPEGVYKIFQVFFGSDGSLHVNFPYFSFQDGLLSLASIPANATYPMDLELTPSGKITTHRVKYSHHPDGRAHFSQDGKIYTVIRKKSVPLSNYKGHIFTVTIWGVNSFSSIKKDEWVNSSDKRTIVTFEFNHVPNALKFVGMWYSIETLNQSRLNVSISYSTSPKVSLLSPDGKIRTGILLLDPYLGGGNKYALILYVEEVVSKDTKAALTFIGGFDPSNIINNLTCKTTILCLLYPTDNVQELAKYIGSVDFTGRGPIDKSEI